MSVVKRFASDIFNALPDRINMFGRYMTGFGGDGLQLDKSTERALVAATEKPPTIIDINAPNNAHFSAPCGSPGFGSGKGA